MIQKSKTKEKMLSNIDSWQYKKHLHLLTESHIEEFLLLITYVYKK